MVPSALRHPVAEPVKVWWEFLRDYSPSSSPALLPAQLLEAWRGGSWSSNFRLLTWVDDSRALGKPASIAWGHGRVDGANLAGTTFPMKMTKLIVFLAALTLGASLLAAEPPSAATPGQFMSRYERLLQNGDREGIIALYSEKGTLVVVDGLNDIMSPAQTAEFYRKEWPAPEGFAWRDLSYRAMSESVVLVSGGFVWRDAKRPGGAAYNYSATLVRENGAWKIRSEAEFIATPASTASEAAAVVAATKPETPTPEPAPPGTKSPDGTFAIEAKSSNKILEFVRPYEPVLFGLSRDEGDEMKLDFTVSLMFPLFGDYWDAMGLEPDRGWPTRKLYALHSAIFFSGTVRAAQYIAGRPSAPVVEKRFNPQLFWRYWIPDRQDHDRISTHRYLDFIPYGHESNGQSISTLESFNQQREIYRNLENDPASALAARRSFLSARDSISRGWDYVGLEGSWASADDQHIYRLKVREFLPHGMLQGDAEQSHDWEGFGPTHPRRQYDGLMFQYVGFFHPVRKYTKFLQGRYALTYTTGLSHPGERNTFQLDFGASFFRRPISLWFRSGYNSDLIDYFQRDNSAGIGITIWSFTGKDTDGK